MNDKFTNLNQEDVDFAEKLNSLSEQTHLDPRFANELERKLKAAHKPKTVWLKSPGNAILPSLGWIALVVIAGLALIWTIENLIPKPQPAANQTPSVLETATPASDIPIENATQDPNRPGIDFRGAKLILGVSMPVSPAQAYLYPVIDLQPATAGYTQALANQLGIQGSLYTTQGQNPSQSGLMVTDGKQQLVVYSENIYTYIADLVKNARNSNGNENANAEAVIREFLSSHGFDFSYTIEKSSYYGGYILQQLTPDGVPVQNENFYQPPMRITLDENGNVLSLSAMMTKYDPAPIGDFGIISSDEALQNLLDDTLPGGKIETSHSGPDFDYTLPQIWYKDEPDNQTVTIFGNIAYSKAVEADTPGIVFINNVPLTGNTTGLDTLDNYAFIEATGQFITENGVRTFHADTWDQYAQNVYVFGSAKRQGDQTIMVNEDGSHSEYLLIDPPSDLPLDTKFPGSQLNVNGALVNGQLHWISIEFYADTSHLGGGGGGGGIMGFYRLNLSGTPIPFPTATPVKPGYSLQELATFQRYIIQAGDTLSQIAATYNISVDELMQVNYLSDTNIFAGQTLILPGVPGPTRVDGERGTVVVTNYVKPNGKQRTEYTFVSQKDRSYYQLLGNNLDPLKDMENRPIALWGTFTVDKDGLISINVEKFENLYPDLQFQILNGTQESTEVNGEQLVLFTTGGVTYVQMDSGGVNPDTNYFQDAGEVLVETLQVPDESYAGYPTLRVFNIGPSTNPATGEKIDLPRSAYSNEPLPDPYGNANEYIPPDMVIDKVELIYLVTAPRNPDGTPDISQTTNYLQPAWHFTGHYANGGVVDILVQALKPEYLSPDMSPSSPPG